jgi:DNA-binding CsgD family transcriptional regulator
MSEMPGPDLLTPREADVLELLQQGRSNAEIAVALHVGVETVRTHARNIYRKLGVRTRRDLASLAGAAPRR